MRASGLVQKLLVGLQVLGVFYLLEEKLLQNVNVVRNELIRVAVCADVICLLVLQFPRGGTAFMFPFVSAPAIIAPRLFLFAALERRPGEPVELLDFHGRNFIQHHGSSFRHSQIHCHILGHGQQDPGLSLC